MRGCRRLRGLGAFRLILVSAAAVGWSGEAVATPTPTPERVLVQVLNRASVSREVLELAQHDVIAIYRDIGVEVVWAETGTETALSTSRPLLIQIITDALPHVSEKAMGVALRGDSAEGSGQFAYVFYGRIRDVGQRSRYPAVTAHILGAVMAHEMGHLLLPYGHSLTGLMRADWSEQEMQGPNFTWLRFTRSQGDLIHRHLAQPEHGSNQ